MQIIQGWEQMDSLPSPYKEYLSFTKTRIPNSETWDFTHWGCWIILESFEELYLPLKINNIYTLPSIQEGLLAQIELIEEHFGVYEIVVLLDNDFGVGILIQESKIPQQYKENLERYKLPISA